MTDKMREAFEKWAVDQGINVSWKSGDEYMVGGTIIAWNAWQAAQSEQAAELERLRKEAERYRWLRDGNSIQIFGVHESWTTSHRLDAVIDAAIAGEKNHG